MFAGRQLHRTQHIVGTEVGSLHTIDVGRPTLVVVDLREDRYGIRRGRVGVTLVVGAVVGHRDVILAHLAHGGRDQCAILAGNYGRRVQIDLPQLLDLARGGRGIAHLANKPGRAIGRRAQTRLGASILSAHNQVARIEHIEHIAIGLREVAIDQILVAGELRTVVATHRAVEVGGGGVVEGAHREVHDAVARLLVLQDRLVGGRHRRLATGGRDEIVVREETQIDRYEVDEHHHRKGCSQGCATDASIDKEYHSQGGEGNHHERTPGVGLHHGYALRNHRLGQHLAPLDIDPLVDIALQVVGGKDLAHVARHQLRSLRCAKRAERTACDDHHQAETARHSASPGDSLQRELLRTLRAEQLAECQRTQHRYGPLHHHKGHRNGAELIVAGQVVEEELREAHQVATPSQE